MNFSKKKANDKAQEKQGSEVKVPEKTLAAKKSAKIGLKPIILTALCAIVILVLCVGVGIQTMKPKTVVTVDKAKITMDDMLYPIYEVESQYASYNEMYMQYMGTSFWDSAYQSDSGTAADGVTNSIAMKSSLLNQEVEYEILYNKAVKEGYKLTADEKKDIEKQVADATKGLSWMQKLRLNISNKNLTKRFEKRTLANRYKEDIQEDLNKDVDEDAAIKDISKEDYRQYDIQFYSVATTETDDEGNTGELSTEQKKALEAKMQKIAAEASKKDADFEKLIDEEEKEVTFESDANFTESSGWSYVSEDNLKKIKKMKNGEVSGVIKDETAGYYVVVKMINNNSEEAYETACDDAIKSQQDAAYTTWYNEEEEKHKVVVNTEVWTDVTLGSVTTDIVTVEDLADMQEDASSDAGSSEE